MFYEFPDHLRGVQVEAVIKDGAAASIFDCVETFFKFHTNLTIVFNAKLLACDEGLLLDKVSGDYVGKVYFGRKTNGR